MIDRDALLRTARRANPVPDSDPLPVDLDNYRPPLAVLIESTSERARRNKWRPAVLGDLVAPRWRGPLIAAATGLVVLIAAIPAVLMRGESEDVPVATIVVPVTTSPATTEPPAVTAVPSTTTPSTAAPLAESLGMTWHEVETDAFEGGWIAAVAKGDSGLVAVGGSRHGAEVWVSDDGSDWERIESEEFPSKVGLDGDAYMADVVLGPSGFVAVGEDNGRAVVWLSPDGRTWSRAPHDDAVFGSSVMWHVVMASFGLVGVGEFEDGIASWTSSDGVIWTRSSLAGAHREDVFSMDWLGFQRTRMDLIGWNDLVIAVGSAHLGEEWTYRPAVWITNDGATWQMIPDDGVGTIDVAQLASGDPAQALMVAISGDETELFALGWVEDVPFSRPAVWSSEDGKNWELRSSVIQDDQDQWRQNKAIIARVGGRLVIGISDNRNGTLLASADGGESWFPTGSISSGFGSELYFSAGGELYWTINDIIEFEDSSIVVGRRMAWSSTEDIGGRCYWDPGDGSAGSCRTDAAVWIGNWNDR